MDKNKKDDQTSNSKKPSNKSQKSTLHTSYSSEEASNMQQQHTMPSQPQQQQQHRTTEISTISTITTCTTTSSRSNSATTLLINSATNSRLAAATRQLGGKGTVRRKVRKNVIRANSDASNPNSEHMRSFLNKFDFVDYGPMDRVTFFEDSGRITSYDQPRLMANTKSHFYYFHLTQGSKLPNIFYKHHKQLTTITIIRYSCRGTTIIISYIKKY